MRLPDDGIADLGGDLFLGWTLTERMCACSLVQMAAGISTVLDTHTWDSRGSDPWLVLTGFAARHGYSLLTESAR
jgi:hypothetical protein